MTIRTIRKIALLPVVALGLAAAAPHANWNATVTQEANGAFTLGNPKAKVKLTEYVSYTCSHCANFHRQSDGPLRLAYVPQGKVAVTVHQMLRNPIDLTVAMLTNCGDPKRFFTRHAGFMGAQDKWLPKADKLTEAQTARWSSGPVPTRLRAIASDLDFYTIMGRWNYSRVQVDRCLGDGAVMKRLTAQTEQAAAAGVEGTPSFALNGELLTGTHEWKLLAPQIDAKL